MVLQNYQNFIEVTSNMIYIVAFGGGLKCPRKIHLNTQCLSLPLPPPPPPESLTSPSCPKKRSFCIVDLTKKSKQIPALKALFSALDIFKSNSNAFQLSNTIPILNPGHKKNKLKND